MTAIICIAVVHASPLLIIAHCHGNSWALKVIIVPHLVAICNVLKAPSSPEQDKYKLELKL